MDTKMMEKMIASYRRTGSILETAAECGVSTVKVRKALITEGLWSSRTSEEIGQLLELGLTTAEIADRLCMSVKNVQAYMPYERGTYGGEARTMDAMRAENYRSRMRTAAGMQVVEKKANRSHEEDNMATKKKVNQVIKLHLELDLSEDGLDELELDVLRSHGGMKKAISRDVLVPGDITLHGLHYAILRMFGWQNGHLHHFALPQEAFDGLTEGKFAKWAELAGVYFRFPSEDFADIYWDDDYKEGQSIRSWLRKKYTGPYTYKGFGEHYLYCQKDARYMFFRWPVITVREFAWPPEKAREPYDVRLDEATVDQVGHAFSDVECRELLERLPLRQILRVQGEASADMDAVKHLIAERLEKIELGKLWGTYDDSRFTSMKKVREFLEGGNIPVLPVTDLLRYSYDYGDDWNVKITAEAEYTAKEDGGWDGAAAELAALLDEVAEKHRPICIAKDGIELVDDVGGIHGFCEMLETIYNVDPDDKLAWKEREEMLAWASMMGWTGRNISPMQTL